ncbi:MAG TPA: glycerol-3-phosphate 1-O-acyltransferase PlsY [Fimbriimonadaceae bacterium]|nr:glycerol-3-phosphate 1-O-acyltransferase PlsY [Fimbriimonadaceae bacterium]
MLAGLFVAAYLLGAVPVGVLVARAHGVDIRTVGSGNIGATNVKRALGMGWAIFVFVFDMLKGFAPTFAARFVSGDEWVWYLVGIAAVAGHCASPFLKFKGGKGVATSLGMVLGGSTWVALGGFAVFALILVPPKTRYISLASIIGVGCAALIGAALRDWTYVAFGSLLFLFVLYTHRANINRLQNGTEPRFKFGKDRPPKDDGGEE